MRFGKDEAKPELGNESEADEAKVAPLQRIGMLE
jgi:hypothetical protein